MRFYFPICAISLKDFKDIPSALNNFYCYSV